MAKGTFEGKAENGDIQEALADAIGKAKAGLRSEIVKWRLERLSGEDGGIAPHREVIVRIQAQSPSSRKTNKTPSAGKTKQSPSSRKR